MSPPMLIRPALTGLFLGSLATFAVPASAPVAQASSIYHCSGWQGCEDAGYSTAGYINAYDRMYWRMYSGHNCTNYVAYRMIKAGMPAERPWSGTGMAYNWGRANRSITDQTPTVGSVAWWDSGAAGMSSSGHVAYVEKVISPTKIVVSEDAWSGTFHWRTIIKDGSSWPSGFIHFIDQKQLEVKNPPRVEGTPQVGAAMRGFTGLWSAKATYAFQWLADGAAIDGATRATYVPTTDVLGKALSVQVTARKDGFVDGVAVSAASEPVTAGAITSTGAPTIAGEAIVDGVLTATPGGWTPSPDSRGLRWKANGVVIKGASGASLTLTGALVGKTITVQEVARKDGYAKGTSPASNALGPVIRGEIEVVEPATATGTGRYGSALAISSVEPTTSNTTTAITWLRDGVAIPGATGADYQLGVDDVGHRIAATLEISKPGWTTYRQTFDFGLVTTPSKLTATATGKPRAALVAVSVTAPGAVPEGLVTVRIGKHAVMGTLVDGAVTVRVPGLNPGKRHVKVEYAGTDVVDAAKWGGPVRVTR